MCWRSLTIISRHQLDQKILRVCISYTHPYPIKSLNHTLPFRICKLCFQANIQITSTLWPDIKSQKLSEHRFRLNWTKCSPRTTSKPVKTRQTPAFRQEEAQDSPLEGDGGGWWPGHADRPGPWAPPPQVRHMSSPHGLLKAVLQASPHGSLLEIQGVGWRIGHTHTHTHHTSLTS